MKAIKIVILCLFASIKGFGQYSNIQKVDFYSGDPSKIAWAGIFINYIEQKNFQAIKENFGVDSAQILNEAKYINKNYNWPEEVTPGWLKIDDGKDHYVRTYFDKLGDTYTYQYQVEVSFDKTGSPAIDFRQNDKVISLDEILDLYFRRIENADEVKADPNKPCEKIIVPDKKWLEDAKSLASAGDHLKADILFNKYLWKNPEDSKIYQSKARNLLNYGMLNEAALTMTKVLEFDKSEFNYYLRGYLYRKLEKNELALSDFLQTETYTYKDDAIDIYLEQDKPQKALELMNTFNPKVSSYFYCTKAKIYKALSQMPEYQIALDSCILINDKNSRGYETFAQTLFRLGEYSKSVVYHRKALAIESIDKSSVLLDLAEALITDHQYEESQKITEKLLLVEGLAKKDRFIYLYLNLIAKGLNKAPVEETSKNFDALILNSAGIEKNQWDFKPFQSWLKTSDKLTDDDKKFINKITNKAITVLR